MLRKLAAFKPAFQRNNFPLMEDKPMSDDNSHEIIDDSSYNPTMDEAEENLRTDESAEEIFGDEERAEKTGELITRFVASYEQHKDEQPLEEWLADEFRRYPAIWKDEEEILGTARDIILSIRKNNAGKESLYGHLDASKSQASWLAGQGNRIKRAVEFREYVDGIRHSIPPVIAGS
jgi:hypothetical protein